MQRQALGPIFKCMGEALLAVFQKRTTYAAGTAAAALMAFVSTLAAQDAFDFNAHFTAILICITALLLPMAASQVVKDWAAGGHAPSKAEAKKAAEQKLEIELQALRAKLATPSAPPAGDS